MGLYNLSQAGMTKRKENIRNSIWTVLCCIGVSCFPLQACSGGKSKPVEETQKQPADTVYADAGTLPVIDFQKSYPKREIPIQELADVEYIPLETHDSALLNSKCQIKLTDRYFITYSEEAVCFFLRDGRFSHAFDHHGSSGKEYIALVGLTVDVHAKEVFVTDVHAQRIQVYDFEGTYLRTLKTPYQYFFSRTIVDYDERHLVGQEHFLVDNKEFVNNPNKVPYYKIDKRDGKLTPLPVKVTGRKRVGDDITFDRGELYGIIPLFVSPIARMCGGVLIAEQALDTMYVFRNDSLCPVAVRRNNGIEQENPFISTLDLITPRYQLWQTLKKELDIKNKSIAEIRTMQAPDPKQYLYDKRTGECVEVQFSNADGISAEDAAEHLAYQNRLSANLYVMPDDMQNVAIQRMPAEFLVRQYESGKLKGRLKEIASRLKEDDNPVLMIARFRE